MESLLSLVGSNASLQGETLNPILLRALSIPNLYFFGELLDSPRGRAHVAAMLRITPSFQDCPCPVKPSRMVGCTACTTSSSRCVAASMEGQMAQLAHSFYEGRYTDFLNALVALHPRLLADRYFAPHAPWYLREMRVAAYVQFLESYKSVTLAGMAGVFGVSVAYLDHELGHLIAAGRVGAKIDALTGIIESSRPDTKNAQYIEVIKQGDLLLNKVQRLARIISS
jgi:hypothetical protein